MNTASPKVAISYAHGLRDAEVVALADRLRRDGVDCDIDVYDDAPAQGWSRRMTDMMMSQTVLVVASQAYYRRFHRQEDPGVGLGVTYESGLLAKRIVASQGSNRSVIPVLLDADDRRYIPEPLNDFTFYVLPTEYDKLYRRLTDQPEYRKPPLGERRVLPSANRATVAAMPHGAASDLAAPMRDVVLVSDGTSLVSVPFTKLARDAALKVTLAPRSGTHEAAVIANLRGSRKTIGLAWGLNAVSASVGDFRETRQDGEQRVELELAEEPRQSSFASDVSLNSISADEIAAMRARRILLDEKLPKAGGDAFSAAQLNQKTLETFISGSSMLQRSMEVKRSSLPPLGERLRNDPDEWLPFARLTCVMLLLLTNTVEHIVRLDVGPVAEDRVHIEFVGIRARAYQNVEPPTITVSGDCPLD